MYAVYAVHAAKSLKLFREDAKNIPNMQFTSVYKLSKTIPNIYEHLMKIHENWGIFLPEGSPGASWATLGAKMAPGPKNDPTVSGRPGAPF